MPWTCPCCGEHFNEPPLCFGIEAPWRALVTEAEFDDRVTLTPDQCVIDERHFFVRGHIEVPILERPKPLAFSVWSSLSEQSFLHLGKRWDELDRWEDPPYFGWLCSPISIYPNTINLQLSVQSRLPGLVPLFTVMSTDHPLADDQRSGISVDRWLRLAHKLMGG